LPKSKGVGLKQSAFEREHGSGRKRTVTIARNLVTIFVVVHMHQHQTEGSKELEIES
jgi:hypothetical protein